MTSERLPPCPFCSISKNRVVAENEHALAIRDGFPISPGHTLVVPRRHAASLFELDEDEICDLWALVKQTQKTLSREQKPDAFNVGVNDGAAAGQTVMHVHIHVIPRFHGDVPDPRGGIRWVVPDKAVYWERG